MSLNQLFISDFSESEKNCQPFNQYLVHILSPVTDNCPSWISGRETMVVEFFFMTMQISTKECAGREDRTCDRLLTRR